MLIFFERKWYDIIFSHHESIGKFIYFVMSVGLSCVVMISLDLKFFETWYNCLIFFFSGQIIYGIVRKTYWSFRIDRMIEEYIRNQYFDSFTALAEIESRVEQGLDNYKTYTWRDIYFYFGKASFRLILDPPIRKPYKYSGRVRNLP